MFVHVPVINRYYSIYRDILYTYIRVHGYLCKIAVAYTIFMKHFSMSIDYYSHTQDPNTYEC